MWPELIQAAKEGGLNTIESYVFWSGHELSPGKVRGGFFFFFGYIFINFIDIFFFVCGNLFQVLVRGKI